MQISVHGTAFASYDLKANKQSCKEVKEDNNSFKDNITQTNEVEEISYHTTTQNDTSIPTIFKDPTNGKYVIASLEQKTLDKLSSHFGDDSIVQKEDGSVKLTGDMEAFVSGWFADIAYKREFLKADENKDGKLSDEEMLNTKNKVEITIDLNKNDEAFISNSYMNISKEDLEVANSLNIELSDSLDDELNMTLKFDSNFDGEISLDEVIVSHGEIFNSIHLEELKNIGIENFELSMEDLDKVLSLMEYMRTLFLNLQMEKELIKVVDNSLLHKTLEPEQVNKILTKELFELLIKKDDKTEDDSLPEIKKAQNGSNENIEKIKSVIENL